MIPHPKLSDAQLRFVLGAIQSESGVIIRPSQAPMVESRLAAFCAGENESDAERLLARCIAGDRLTLGRMVGALTNGETSFFRDPSVFQAFEAQLLPRLLEKYAAEKTLRIWCAACSTGQEPYSLAMMLSSFPGLASWHVSVLGTDISEHRIAYARAGKYTKAEVNRGLPAHRLLRHFTQQEEHYQIRPEVRAMVDFQKLNLLGSWNHLPQMGVVFIRNAMIYWDYPDRASVLERIVAQYPVHGGGVLVLGAAESPLGLGARISVSPTGFPGIYITEGF